MPVWSLPALGAAFFLAVHYLLLRAASGRVEDRLGALVVETAAAAGIALSLLVGGRGAGVQATRTGVLFAAGAGLAVSFVSVLLFVALRRGGPVASTATLVFGGGVALSALAAPLFFSEPFSPRRALGVLLGVLAMAILSHE